MEITAQDQKRIAAVVAAAEMQNIRLSPARVEGFVYALALLPEGLAPGDWLLPLLGREFFAADEQGVYEQQLSELVAMQVRWQQQHHNEQLPLPALAQEPPGQLDDEQRDWLLGLVQGLMLRQSYWSGPQNYVAEEKYAQEVATAVGVLLAVLEPSRAPELFPQAEVGDSLESQGQFYKQMLLRLPAALKTVHRYSLLLITGQRHS